MGHPKKGDKKNRYPEMGIACVENLWVHFFQLAEKRVHIGTQNTVVGYYLQKKAPIKVEVTKRYP